MAGLCGIIRAYDRYRECLKPLGKGKDRIMPLPPCPGKDDVVRHYEVAAVQTKLVYNSYGDHDPDGLIFVPPGRWEPCISWKVYSKTTDTAGKCWGLAGGYPSQLLGSQPSGSLF